VEYYEPRLWPSSYDIQIAASFNNEVEIKVQIPFFQNGLGFVSFDSMDSTLHTFPAQLPPNSYDSSASYAGLSWSQLWGTGENTTSIPNNLFWKPDPKVWNVEKSQSGCFLNLRFKQKITDDNLLSFKKRNGDDAFKIEFEREKVEISTTVYVTYLQAVDPGNPSRGYLARNNRYELEFEASRSITLNSLSELVYFGASQTLTDLGLLTIDVLAEYQTGTSFVIATAPDVVYSSIPIIVTYVPPFTGLNSQAIQIQSVQILEEYVLDARIRFLVDCTNCMAPEWVTLDLVLSLNNSQINVEGGFTLLHTVYKGIDKTLFQVEDPQVFGKADIFTWVFNTDFQTTLSSVVFRPMDNDTYAETLVLQDQAVSHPIFGTKLLTLNQLSSVDGTFGFSFRPGATIYPGTFSVTVVIIINDQKRKIMLSLAAPKVGSPSSSSPSALSKKKADENLNGAPEVQLKDMFGLSEMNTTIITQISDASSSVGGGDDDSVDDLDQFTLILMRNPIVILLIAVTAVLALVIAVGLSVAACFIVVYLFKKNKAAKGKEIIADFESSGNESSENEALDSMEEIQELESSRNEAFDAMETENVIVSV